MPTNPGSGNAHFSGFSSIAPEWLCYLPRQDKPQQADLLLLHLLSLSTVAKLAISLNFIGCCAEPASAVVQD